LNKRIAIKQSKHLKIFALLIGSFYLFSITACKAKKALQQSTESLSSQVLTDRFLSRPDYHFVDGKAKVSFNSEDYHMKGTVYLRTVKDSVIWIAAKKLSVEGGRALITPDSIFYINRLEKTYQKLALARLKDKYGLTADFGYIQDMLLGLTPQIDTTQHWSVTQTAEHCSIEAVIHDILHQFTVDNHSGLVTEGKFMDKFVADGQWTYEEYVYSIDNQLIPKHRTFMVNTSVGEELTMTINITNFEVDQPKAIRFSIPSHYTRQQ